MMVNQHIELLVLDDWGLQLLSAEACRDLETLVVSLIPRTVAAQFWFPKWPLADTRDNRCGRQPGSGG